MRRWWLVSLVASGCAHAPAPPPREWGRTEQPYRGTPFYLQEGYRSRVSAPGGELDRDLVAGHSLTMGARLDRTRALLAAVDAHVVALDSRVVAREDLRALELTIEELDEVLAPFPDLAAEVDELRRTVAALPATPPARVPGLLARMGQLTDLIRLQLLAGR